MSNSSIATLHESVAREPLPGSGVLWALTFLSGIAAIVFAVWGWAVQLDPPQSDNPLLTWERVGVRSVQVLVVADIPEPADMKPGADLPLSLAQFFGAVFYVLLAGRVLFFTLGARLAGVVLRDRKGHDLVIGAGPAAIEWARLPMRRTTHMSFGFRADLGRSATIDRLGVLGKQLQRAGARHARQILVDEGDDADTWETAQAAARINRDIDVVAYIRDPWIHERLSRASPEARLRTFSYASGVARQIMLAHPPYLLARRYKAPVQHILVFGFGPVGQSIVREFLVTSLARDPAKMMVTAVDPDIEQLKSDFLGRMPGLDTFVDLDFIPGDKGIEGEAMLKKVQARNAAAEVCAIYVAIDTGSQPLSFAYILRDRAQALGIRAPIFFCAQHGAGLRPARQGAGLVGQADIDADSLQASGEGLLYDRKLSSFGSWTDALDGSGLFEDPLDGHAKAFHDGYLALNPPDAGNPLSPAQAPWERLSDEFRVANRRVAAHIRAKLDAVGFDLDGWLGSRQEPWRSHDLPPVPEMFDLSDPILIDQLADLEHRRWMIDRALNGWRYGPVRDNRARIHPDMIPTSELSEAAFEKDRSNVRKTVELLWSLVGKKRARR